MLPTIDVANLRRVLEYVTTHPDEWNQARWFSGCSRDTPYGTSRCVAGTTIYLLTDATVNPFPVDFKYVTYRGELRSVADVARRTLGLTLEQALRLFFRLNTLVDLWQLASEFTHEILIPVNLTKESSC